MQSIIIVGRPLRGAGVCGCGFLSLGIGAAGECRPTLAFAP